MRVLSPSEELRTLGGPVLLVRIFTFYRALTVVTELFEDVSLVRNATVKLRAITWRKDGICDCAVTQDFRITRDYIKDRIDEFLNAWLAVNPKQR